MGPQLYWIVFGILVIFIVALAVYLVLNIVKDFCLPNNEVPKKRETVQQRQSVRYNFDVEDLTKIEGDLTRVAPRMSLVNEVDINKVRSLLGVDNKRTAEGDTTRSSLNSNQSILLKIDDKPEKKETDLYKSIDNLEYWDPTSLEVLKTITNVETNARRLEEYMKGFLGRLGDLQYYEINEKFIRFQIQLCDIYCDRDDLRNRKADVFKYIKKCQEDLRAGKR